MDINPQSFKRKYDKLLDIRKKYLLYNRLGRIAVLFMMVTLVAPTLFKTIIDLPLGLFLLFMAIPMVVSVFFLNRSNKYIFTSKQRMFFKFYKTEIELETFLDLRTPQSKKNAKKSIEELASYVSLWISASAPNALNELPRNISINLQEKMIPVIEKEIMQKIHNYRTTLYNFIIQINDKEPSIDDLIFFNNTFGTMTGIPIVIDTHTTKFDIKYIPHKTKELFLRNPKLTYIPIGIISYVAIWIYVQNTQSVETIKLFVDNSTIAGVIIAIIAILPSLLKQKSNSTTIITVGDDKSSKN